MDADADLTALSRKAWADLETLHVVGYFAPEVTAAYVDEGLDPRLAYFPGRAAALGAAGPGLVVATFYVFAPWLVEAALPSAWHRTTPERMVAARRAGVSAALPRLLGEPDVQEPAGIARDVCAGLAPQGRPLFAAHASLPWPEEPLLALWHAATLVREHRGDGHVAVLQTAGLDPVEATVLGGLFSGSTRFLRKTRGWSQEEYAAAEDRLHERGWLDGDGALTGEGRSVREGIEADTDRLALSGWEGVGAERTARLHELLRPLRRAVLESGVLPRSLAAPRTDGPR